MGTASAQHPLVRDAPARLYHPSDGAAFGRASYLHALHEVTGSHSYSHVSHARTVRARLHRGTRAVPRGPAPQGEATQSHHTHGSGHARRRSGQRAPTYMRCRPASPCPRCVLSPSRAPTPRRHLVALPAPRCVIGAAHARSRPRGAREGPREAAISPWRRGFNPTKFRTSLPSLAKRVVGQPPRSTVRVCVCVIHHELDGALACVGDEGGDDKPF